MPNLFLAQEPAANDILADDPLALLVGMLLDQQIPLEKAFTGPYLLAERMGTKTLDAEAIAAYDPEAMTEIFAAFPAIHRFPKAMAERTQKLCRTVIDEFGGDASTVWTGAADGKDLVARISTLPGFGKQKAQIFAALLGKQFGVQPRGWRAAAGDYGAAGSFRSVADIVDAESLAKVRDFKKKAKAAAKAAAADK